MESFWGVMLSPEKPHSAIYRSKCWHWMPNAGGMESVAVNAEIVKVASSAGQNRPTCLYRIAPITEKIIGIFLSATSMFYLTGNKIKSSCDAAGTPVQITNNGAVYSVM
ncbi:hypothetical protein [Microbulbifer marinus]|uniref:hypothetical protein n=1 Tax=Microbulbifer marinus TaxID=658218 RepID=UPI0011151087|nr:hypothetical protein [Microbulbifer marinus]